jgi:hypothetical protein
VVESPLLVVHAVDDRQVVSRVAGVEHCTGKITDQLMMSVGGTYTNAKLDHPTVAYASSIYGTNGQPYCPVPTQCTVPRANVKSGVRAC